MSNGHEFWRSLDELSDDPSFVERLHNEFPSEIEAINDPVARRTFLKLMGASLALAGVTACTKQPVETIVPYVQQPEALVPGRPLFFATAMPLGGSANPLLVESHEGRPTKIEGNPQHPASAGAADVFGQAAILGLYDPDRAQTLTHRGEIRSWGEFAGAMRAALFAQQPLKGAGVRILTESISSPALADQIRTLLQKYPSARWHQWDPASRENVRAGAKLAFGDYADAQYRIDQADVIVSLDSDFLASGPGSLRYARDFAERRKPQAGDRMNRLYAIESMPTSTGARADHRLPLKPSEIGNVARRIAAALGVGGAIAGPASGEVPKWVAAVAKDLQAHRGTSLVIAGDGQPAEIHALAHAMNDALGNAGRTVVFTDPVEAQPIDQLASLKDLVADMNAGKVDLLLIVESNPVYTAPSDIDVAGALRNLVSHDGVAVHLGLHRDETSALCQWQVPAAHFLEAWSDARAYDGTVSIVQPLIAPLYDGKSAHELFGLLGDRPGMTGYEIVRDYWNRQKFGGARPAAGVPNASGASATGAANPQERLIVGSAPSGSGPATAAFGERQMNQAASQGAPAMMPEFESAWRRWLHDGFIPDTAFAPKTLSAKAASAGSATVSPGAQGFEIVFKNDPTVLDGRFANNGWLQELPKPITRLTWDNAVLLSPATFDRLGLDNRPSYQGGEHGQIFSPIVELKSRGRSVYGPAFPVAGIPEDCIVVHLGYGRARAGQVGNGAGFNANAFRVSAAMAFDGGVEIAKTRDRYSLACVQYHHLMEGRNQIRALTLEEYKKDPKAMLEGDETPPRTLTLYPDYKYEGYKWGMSIDVNACVGCNACVVACVAENNIPVVGKEQVLRGREMHWLRVDTYYRGSAANPETYFQPVPCMQCENAPCEVVCPVGATVHSAEGLNDMVYNRCVGTRYCSNNCPYKVRRFNFFLYQDWDTPTYKLMRNPDVTVRSRGVMEKCTYCVQRINAAKIDSEKQDRRIADGEIQTACQATCPADAIVFGDLNDPGARVVQLKAEERNYSLLGELNTRPRTTYLGAVRNVNPELTA